MPVILASVLRVCSLTSQGKGRHTMTSRQRENFKRDLITTEIMITGNDDYQEAQDKAEKEIQKGMELDGFQMVEF